MTSGHQTPVGTPRADPAAQTELVQLRAQVLALQLNEARLLQSEDRYRQVVENLSQGMMVVQNERVVFVNAQAAALARMTREDMLANGFLHVVHPDDRAHVLDIQKRRREGLTAPDRYELRLLHTDGAVTWLEVGVTQVPWDGQRATLTFCSNINHRKDLEAQYRTTLHEREAILNSTLVGISYNVNRRVEWVNDKYIEITGFTREEIIGSSSRIFYDNDAAYLADGQTITALLVRDGTYIDERLIRRRNGEPFWVVLAGRCVVDRNPDAGVIWTMLDVTEQHRAKEDMLTALQRQTELNELRSRFVSMTSHEFRTPLATILSSAELLRYYSPNMSAGERVESLANIEAAVHRMTRMLERVLLIGKSDAHMLEYLPTRLNLGALCRTLADEAVSQAGEATSRLACEFKGEQTHALYDEKLLRHIFSNLLSNALKYSQGSGPVVFRVNQSEERTLMEVLDNGIGIPSAEIPHLFASFHRASNVGNIPGTGLGLSIVKKSVELHGGTIEVFSELGQGTRFTVTFQHKTPTP